jgi:hypothetical protein
MADSNLEQKTTAAREAVTALRQIMTPAQVAAVLEDAEIDAFHAHEAANAPVLPRPDAAAFAALKSHLTDGAGHKNPQAELLAAHVALHQGDWAGFSRGVIAHYKVGLHRIPKAAIDAALVLPRTKSIEGGPIAAPKA